MTTFSWEQPKVLSSRSFICGYCGESIASHQGYQGHTQTNPQRYVYIYLCHKCYQPTFFDYNGKQTPGPVFGQSVKHIPDPNIQKLFNEARSCYTIAAYTSCTMCCRKLLMNLAVIEGAPEGKSFVDYVNYLESKNFIPPRGKQWVDTIRKTGNEANHSIEFKTPEEARLVLTFTEMLLRFIFEMPGMLDASSKP